MGACRRRGAAGDHRGIRLSSLRNGGQKTAFREFELAEEPDDDDGLA